MDLRGALALSGTVFFWAVTPVILRHLSGHLDAWTANGVRYPLASLLYLPILLVGLRRGAITRGVLRKALGPATFALTGQVLWALSPYYLDATMVGFLVKLSAVWAFLGAMVVFPDERALLRQPRFHVGFLLAVLGFVSLALGRKALSGAVSIEGLSIITGCSFFFGLYGVSVRYWLDDVNPAYAYGVVAQFVSLGTLVLMFARGTPSAVADLPAREWCLLLASAVTGIALSHWLYYIAIRRLGATIATSGHLLGPFVTLTVAAAFLGESLRPLEWIAGTGMLAGAGLLVASRPARSQRRGGPGEPFRS